MDESASLKERRSGRTLAVLLAGVLITLLIVLTVAGSRSAFSGGSADRQPTSASSVSSVSADARGVAGPVDVPTGPPIIIPLDSAAVFWVPAQIPQGTIFQVSLVPERGSVEAVEGTFAGEPLHFRPEDGGTFAALAAAPVDEQGAIDLQLEISYKSAAAEIRLLKVPVVPGDYRMERLTVAPEFGGPQPPEIQRRINEESARAMRVSRSSHETPRMWGGPFIPPRETRITSGFGHGRMFNDQVQSRHMGTDFGGGVGAPVIAPARGIVALVDAFYLGGNVIYLDHGDGLVTAYLHLSEQGVVEGEVVEPGQVIGGVGATGRVTGPHLHWIVRYGVITVDGMSLLDLG